MHPYTKGLLASLPGLNTDQHRLSSIKGSVPAPGEQQPGCPFHPRCQHHKPGICDAGTPPQLDARTDQHAAACHRWREILAEETANPTQTTQRSSLQSQESADVVDLEGRSSSPDSARSLASAVETKADAPGTPIAPPVPTAPPLLSVRDLCKFFPIRSTGLVRRKIGEVRAVNHVTFDLATGETMGIVGESGSGKTTAARAILRAIEPTSGDVLFAHQGEQVNLATLSASDLKPLRQKMQMIFQDPFSSLNPRMTVGDIVGEPLVIHKLASGTALRDRVVEAITRVGLKPDHRTRYPHAFSGGQRQRIGIARALIMNPSLVVADEAVSALDVSVQAQVINLLEDLQEELQLTYIFIAHDLSVVQHICDRAAVMYCGKVVELGDINKMYSKPYHPYTRALLAAVPSPDPDIKLRPAVAGETADPANPPAGCSFHPRCPFAQKGLCDVPGSPPPLQEVEPGQWTACYRWEVASSE
jgi:peptide/nickel transport system ATP-binding protein